MRFARIVFTVAGVWGFLIMTPFLFLADALGRAYPPAITHRDVYYGFVMVTIAWQFAFLIIGRDPVRLRPLMIAAMFEKFAYVSTLGVLWAGGELPFAQASVAMPDLILGVLFVVSFVKTGGASAG
jgi:hypothetical protein